MKQKVTTYFNNRRETITDWLLEEGNNFCAMPYVHMAVESNGDIKPCCVGSSLKNTAGEVLNINGKTIDQALNDPTRHKFVASFDSNHKHPACKVCWGDNNKFLNRIKFSLQDQVIDYTESIMNGADRNRQLMWLEIKPGNRCNLKCRICGVHNSSSWTKDAYQLNRHMSHYNIENGFVTDDKKIKKHPIVPYKQSPEIALTKQCEWIDQESFWTDINGFEEIKLIHFMGGEPFMVPEHFQMLEEMIARGMDTSKISIRYNTNGTYYPNPKQIDILQQFSQIQVLLSIDDIGKRFEYQRNLAVWDQVRENLVKFFEARETMNWQCNLDPTVSMYNVWYIEEIEEEFNKIGFVCHVNRHFVNQHRNDCRYMPEAVKQKVLAKYKDSTSPWVQSVVEYLELSPPVLPDDTEYGVDQEFHNFWAGNNYIDYIRKEKFAEVFPEWYSLLGFHLNSLEKEQDYTSYTREIKNYEQKDT